MADSVKWFRQSDYSICFSVLAEFYLRQLKSYMYGVANWIAFATVGDLVILELHSPSCVHIVSVGIVHDN